MSFYVAIVLHVIDPRPVVVTGNATAVSGGYFDFTRLLLTGLHDGHHNNNTECQTPFCMSLLWRHELISTKELRGLSAGACQDSRYLCVTTVQPLLIRIDGRLQKLNVLSTAPLWKYISKNYKTAMISCAIPL